MTSLAHSRSLPLFTFMEWGVGRPSDEVAARARMLIDRLGLTGHIRFEIIKDDGRDVLNFVAIDDEGESVLIELRQRITIPNLP